MESKSSISRRDFLHAVLGAAFLTAVPSLAGTKFALAEEDLPSNLQNLSQMTVGEYLAAYDPEGYAQMSADMRALVDSEPMFSRCGPSIERVENIGWVSLDAWAGVGSIGYSFTYTCSVACSPLRALVTVTDPYGAPCYSMPHENIGGKKLSGSGTAGGLGSGAHSVVVTAYAPNPPIGVTSGYSQAYKTVYV